MIRFSIYERRLRPNLSEFILKKHQDDMAPSRLGVYSTYLDAEEAIDIHLNYPKELPAVWFDSEGRKVTQLKLAHPSDEPLPTQPPSYNIFGEQIWPNS